MCSPKHTVAYVLGVTEGSDRGLPSMDIKAHSPNLESKDEEIDWAMVEAIGRLVEREWGMGGLSSGPYMDFAKEVLKTYLSFMEWIKEVYNGKEEGR